MEQPTSQQIRAALALLGMEQKDLAESAGLSLRTVETALTGKKVSRASMDAIEAALRGAGIIWIVSDEIRGVAVKT